MPRENIGIVARRGGDLLPLFDLRERAQKVPVGGGLLVPFGIGSNLHARLETFDQIMAAAFEKHFRIASGFRVELLWRDRDSLFRPGQRDHGLTPLYLRYADLWDAVEVLRSVLTDPAALYP